MARTVRMICRWFSHTWKVVPIFFLLWGSACQPVSPPLPAPEVLPSPTKTLTPESTPAASPTSPSPIATTTITTTPSTPDTFEPTATPHISALSPEGPWLVYRQDIYYGMSERYDKLIVMNQDGSGRTLIKVNGCAGMGDINPLVKVPGCDSDYPLLLEEDPSSRIVNFSGRIMLIQPFQAAGKLLYQGWPSLHTAFTGDNKGGFLASLSAPAEDAIPELHIYTLPEGKLLDQFPLVRCPGQMQDCPFGDAGWWEIQWSPDGRYLAFPAIWDDPSTDLYIYDIENGRTRQLTSGPEYVGQIWWSPDGHWIVMGETNWDPPFTSSLWAISVRGDEPRLLYSLEHPFPQGIVGWVDSRRLIVFDGTTLSDALDLPAEDLRLVDIWTGEITTLFAGLFYSASIDTTSQTLAVYAYDDPPNFEMGTYLVPINDPVPRLVTNDRYPSGQINGYWNGSIGLFVTDIPCEDDPQGSEAFDIKGAWQCVHTPVLPDSYPSPDGQWRVSLKDGVWLEARGKPAIQVSADQAEQAIWCPDSGCFFFVANKTLFHVSLPDLVTTMVDDGLKEEWIAYQWLK